MTGPKVILHPTNYVRASDLTSFTAFEIIFGALFHFRIQLVKSTRHVKDQCWLSLLEGQFTPGYPVTTYNMALKYV